MAESSCFPRDPGIWKAVTASNGGAVEAALEAVRTRGVAGSLSSGLHHAGYDRGGGFCTFNGLVLAAVAARKAAAGSILIPDFDTHFGDGTEELIEDEDGIVTADVSASRPPAGTDYLEACRRCLNEITDERGPFGLVIDNAGMDPHEDCFLGGRKGIDESVQAQREAMVFRHPAERNWPVAFVPAGGHSNQRMCMKEIVELHRLTIQAAVDSTPGASNRTLK